MIRHSVPSLAVGMHAPAQLHQNFSQRGTFSTLSYDSINLEDDRWYLKNIHDVHSCIF